MSKRNRGKQPNDDKIFAPRWYPIFKDATDDLCFLLSRGYGEKSALAIIGNRYKLNKRQRQAIQRISASEQEIQVRLKSQYSPECLASQQIEIDGFNLLILLESALSGGYILKCRDGIYRDMSSVHGSYKRVVQTEKAILLVGTALQRLKVAHIKWYLDQPISNSGRLKSRLLELGEVHQFDWEVELDYSPDKVLIDSHHIVVSSDAWILNEASRWFNLGAYIIEKDLLETTVVAV